MTHINLSASNPVLAINAAYDAPLRIAQEYQRAGGKVVGYVSTAVPQELIAASGAMPLMIKGDVHRATPLADEWMESQFDPMARSIFDMALAGELEFLDLLIVPRVADSFMRLYLYLREVERLGLCKRLPKLMQFDLLQSNFRTSEDYNLARCGELRDELRKLCGHAISDDAIHAAIFAANENRAALRALLQQRSAGRIDGAQTLRALGSRYAMPIAEHTALINEYLSQLSQASAIANNAPRILVAGNAQDNTVFYEYLAAHGCQIVGDYQWLGDNVCIRDIESNINPLLAIAEHYQKYALSSRRFPQSNDELIALVRANRAQGVVFYLFAAEEALSWDVPNQVRALEKANIATLIVDDQPYGPLLDAALDTKVADFCKRLTLVADHE